MLASLAEAWTGTKADIDRLMAAEGGGGCDSTGGETKTERKEMKK
jgi:hypothetical protein